MGLNIAIFLGNAFFEEHWTRAQIDPFRRAHQLRFLVAGAHKFLAVWG
jgi:hypothetical protein